MTLGKNLEGVSSRVREPRVAVIREEFANLTKDPLVAVVLNQLVYWTQRVKDFDFFLQEEQSINPNCNVQPRHGWIYKTAEELVQETMLQVSKSTMLRYLNTLLTSGWIDKRSNATDKWDRTIQYRVNLRKLQEDLMKVGHTLPGSALLLHPATHSSSLKEAEMPRFQNGTTKVQNATSTFQNETSTFQNRTSNTEITTKIKNKEQTAFRTQACELKEDVETPLSGQIPQDMLETWKTHVGQEGVILTEARKSQLFPLLKQSFDNDLKQWEQFCSKVKASRFLMGEGARKWRVNLDWILREENVRKVLEGNYDNPKEAEEPFSLKETVLSFQQEKQIHETLKCIEDNSWRQFCSQLQFNSRFSSYVPLWQLEEIVGARLLGFEDERLAWIVCQDKTTLSRISNLRFQILTAIQKTHPKISAIRTCLEGDIEPSLLSASADSSQLLEAPTNDASSCPLGDPIDE
jgi:DNA-binding MarR family transcriptional regulator